MKLDPEARLGAGSLGSIGRRDHEQMARNAALKEHVHALGKHPPTIAELERAMEDGRKRTTIDSLFQMADQQEQEAASRDQHARIFIREAAAHQTTADELREQARVNRDAGLRLSQLQTEGQRQPDEAAGYAGNAADTAVRYGRQNAPGAYAGCERI